MKVYLAAAFSRKAEVKEIAYQLENLGLEITSRWLDEPVYNPAQTDRVEFMAERAQIDLDDIDRADILVRFSDDLSAPTVPSRLATGSRMGETLWALAHNKPVIVIGGHQCVFDYLPEVMHAEDLNEFIQNIPNMEMFLKCPHPRIIHFADRELCPRCLMTNQRVDTSTWWKPWTWGRGYYVPLQRGNS